jgi:penicillin-binding protein-related factor A (putative recombinase)
MMTSSDVDDAMIYAEGESVDFGAASLRRETVNPLSCGPHQSKSLSSVRSRRAISRVVVLHNDKIASFSDSSPTDNYDVPADFFDTPEFWSGSITWW